MIESKPQKFFTNFFSILGGQSLSLILGFISITLITRYLSVEEFGLFSYILALVSILSKFIDLGLSPITFRESSRKEGNFVFLNTAVSLRLILFLIVLVIFNVAGWLLALTTLEIVLADILFLNILFSAKFQNFRDLLDIPFKISLSSYVSMIGIMLDNFVFLLLILFTPFFQASIYYVVTAYVISNIPGFFFVLNKLHKNYNYRFHFSLANWKWLIKESGPLITYVIILSIFQQVDLLILKYMDSEFATGIYSVALRLTLPLMIIPSAIASTIFPTLVKNVTSNEKQNIKINKFIYKLLFFSAFVITILFSLKAKIIITLIFGPKYSEAYLPMIFLLVTQIFLFYNFHTINLMTAYNRQKKIIIYVSAIMILNLILNLILIPLYSYTGAGLSKLIAIAAGTFILSIIVTKEGLNFNFFNFKTVIWCVVVSVLLYGLNYLSWPFYFISALIIIIFISLKLKYFEDDEIMMIFKLIHREKWGLALLRI